MSTSSTSTIALINSTLQRVAAEQRRAGPPALPATTVMFFGFTMLDDQREDMYDMLPAEAGPSNVNAAARMRNMAQQPPWDEKVNIIPRFAGQLVAAVRSTEFLAPGVDHVDDLVALERMDELPQWKEDLASFCEACQVDPSRYRASWYVVSGSKEREVACVKLMLEGSGYGKLRERK